MFGLWAFLAVWGCSGIALDRTSPYPWAAQNFSQDIVDAILTTLRTGYVVLDVTTGDVVMQRAAQDLFIPASLAKIPSVIALATYVSGTPRPQTRLVGTGPVVDGVIQGDLVLVGDSDPMFDTVAAADMVHALRRKGIRAVRGRFLFYESSLPFLTSIEPTQPQDAPYNPGLSGLSINFNRYRVVWRDGVAQGVDIPLFPLPLEEDVLTPRSIPSGSAWLPVRRPGFFAALVMRYLAEQEGLMLPKPQKISTQPIGQVLVTYEGDDLYTALRRAFRYSNNIAFEMMALSVTGRTKIQSAARDILGVVKKNVSGTPWSGATLRNASGLSAGTRLSPMQCAAMVRYMAVTRVRDLFLSDLLPRWSEYRGKEVVYAKSGTMSYARALAGLMTISNGKRVAWCIMSDDQKNRMRYDQLLLSLRRQDHEKEKVQAWSAAARQREKILVQRWLSTL